MEKRAALTVRYTQYRILQCPNKQSAENQRGRTNLELKFKQTGVTAIFLSEGVERWVEFRQRDLCLSKLVVLNQSSVDQYVLGLSQSTTQVNMHKHIQQM